jgi:hypothetical protein
VDEREWENCDDPTRMLRPLNMRLRANARRRGRTPDLERLRLFACACSRRIWHLLGEEDQGAVQALEEYARTRDRNDLLKARRTHRLAGNRASQEMSSVSRDHPASEALLLTAWAKNLATSVVWEATATKPTSAANAHLSAARAVGSLQRAGEVNGGGHPSGGKPAIDWQVVSAEELAAQAALLRDLFGPLPFREVGFDLAWLTPAVLSIARRAYDERDFTALPVLADALGDAGCDNQDLLQHCRERGLVHCRGCWVIDLLLGRA